MPGDRAWDRNYSISAAAQSILLSSQRYILRVGKRSAGGAAGSPKKAEIIKDAGSTIPLLPGDFALSRFLLHLSRLEDALASKVKTESTMGSSPVTEHIMSERHTWHEIFMNFHNT